MIFAICHIPQEKGNLLNELTNRQLPTTYHDNANWVFVEGEPTKSNYQSLKALPGVLYVTAALNQSLTSYPWK